MIAARVRIALLRGLVVTCALPCACTETTAGQLCQPGDSEACGPDAQCLTFCDADSGPQSICTPSFGKEAGDEFDNVALIDDKVTFGELGNVRRFKKGLRIEIQEPGIKGVALPLVEEVEGDLSIVGSKDSELECISLPRLTRVTGLITIDLNPRLQKNELASLETAGGLIVTDNDAVEEMLLTSVESFAGDVIIERNQSLRFVNLESLQSVDGDFTMTKNALDELHLDALDEVAGCFAVTYDEGGCDEAPALDTSCCDDTLRGAACAACP